LLYYSLTFANHFFTGNTMYKPSPGGVEDVILKI